VSEDNAGQKVFPPEIWSQLSPMSSFSLKNGKIPDAYVQKNIKSRLFCLQLMTTLFSLKSKKLEVENPDNNTCL
jgi:hypothetical protein